MFANLRIEALTALVERVKALEKVVKESEVRLQTRIEERAKEVKQEITEVNSGAGWSEQCTKG